MRIRLGQIRESRTPMVLEMLSEELTLTSQPHASLVRLSDLMAITTGHPGIAIGLIDGPVDRRHRELAVRNVRAIAGRAHACDASVSAACEHGTLVAGVLVSKRGSAAPAICPDCTLLVRPIFFESPGHHGELPNATQTELAEAIIETVDAGARVINLSIGVACPSSAGARRVEAAVGHALARGVIVTVAAGNAGTIGGSTITSHPWVIPVAAFDLTARPLRSSSLGASIGRRGLGAPGAGVVSLGADGAFRTFSGTSAAAPFVTGTIALLWSAFPDATAAEVRRAITSGRRRSAVVPPLLDARAAYRHLHARYGVP